MNKKVIYRHKGSGDLFAIETDTAGGREQVRRRTGEQVRRTLTLSIWIMTVTGTTM